jgi:hypothetical protein
MMLPGRAAARLPVGILFVVLLVGVACNSPEGPGAAPVQSEESLVLPKQEILDRYEWWDNRHWAWYQKNVPFFDSPDSTLNATYYYRWEVMTKHLTYGDPETGYTFTEFIDRPFWSGAYGAISCPLGHQFYEVRWFKDFRVVDDFAHYWFDTSGAEPRSYSNWYGDSMWAIYEVWQDERFIEGVYPHMQQQYQGWIEERYDPEHEMFVWDGMHDGMETNINSRQTEDTFSGGDGYRPTLNSYLYGDLRALSNAAALLGDSAQARAYDKEAAALKERVQEELWDPDRQFFSHQWAEDKKGVIEAKALTYETGQYAGSPHGRELIGYVPWQFNLPDSDYESAWKYLMDPEYFNAPYGPTTVEQNDPQFYVSDQCCVWSGNSWPYATTQTLRAMANLLNNYEQDIITKADYVELLQTYSKTQRLNGRPHVAEAADPFTGSWDGHNHYYHSEHYLHSGYADLVITGLAGLRPRPDDTLEVNPLVPESWDYFALDDVAYHGHRLSIVWDRDGSQYGRGEGLMLFLNGEKIASAPTPRKMTVQIPPAPERPAADAPVNVAVNNRTQFYPHISASYSHPETPPFYANDGNYWYHESPPNRWTTRGLEKDTTWIGVDFGTERSVNTIKLYFLDDGEGVVPPESYSVQYWDGHAWTAVPNPERMPSRPTGRRPNEVTFEPLKTAKLRVVLRPRAGTATGLTEFEVWSDADPPLPEPEGTGDNLAYNPDTTGYPAVSTSHTYEGDRVGDVNDMKTRLTARTDNRWTAYDSPNERDWVEVDFGEEQQVRRLDLYLWGDDDGVGAPEAYSVEYWTGSDWKKTTVEKRTPERPTAMAKNTVLIEPVRTSEVRVVFEHALPNYAGLAELRVWSDNSLR